MKEYLLTTNNYLEPEVLEGADAYAIIIMRLLLLEPGTNPLHPEMGVGLGPKYRFMSEDDLPDLESRIEDQIATYLPLEFKANCRVDLEINTESKYLSIIIIANNTKYVYDTENSTTPIQLSDLIS